MKIWEWIAIGVAGYFGYELWQKYEAGSNLQVNLQNVDLSGFPNVKVNLSVMNITSTPLTVDSIAGSLIVNGVPLGNFESSQTVTLQPNALTPYSISFNTSLLNLPNAVLQVINQLGGALNFVINGAANVDGIPTPVPFNVNQNFQT